MPKVTMTFRTLEIEGVKEYRLVLEAPVNTISVPITKHQFDEYMNAFSIKRLPSHKCDVMAKQEVFKDVSL